jgi:hypothetical protein
VQQCDIRRESSEKLRHSISLSRGLFYDHEECASHSAASLQIMKVIASENIPIGYAGPWVSVCPIKECAKIFISRVVAGIK